MLIDDRTPPASPGERPVWEPNWPMWGWIAAGLIAFIGASATGGIVSVALLFASIAFAAQAAVRAFPPGAGGMRDHRQ
jgi:hypothetical protein